jgi:hypothetical protein
VASASCRRASYNTASSRDSDTLRLLPVRAGKFCKTSLLCRRNMSGDTSCIHWVRAVGSLSRLKGNAKFLRKAACETSSSGSVKLNSECRSIRLFCIGVPVVIMRKSGTNAFAAHARWVLAFLMACASSRTTVLQCTVFSCSLSFVINP